MSAVVVADVPVFPSEEVHLYRVIAFPPLLGAVYVILSTPADGDDAEGAVIVAGTVVAVTVAADEAADVPDAFVAVTVTE